MVAERGTSLRRGIQILIALGSDAAEGGLGVTQIAALTGHEKSQVSRALSALSDYGLAERSPGSANYRLGWGCFALAGRAGEPRLLEEARGALAQLVDEVAEAAHLSVLRGDEVLTLLTQSPSHAIVARSWVGRTVPAHCTSSGRALLWDRDRAALVALLGPGPFHSHGPNAPADAAELQRRIRRATELGYATADEESEPGLVAVAAPVRDFTGWVIAALNVSAPKFRLGTRLEPTGELVRAAAEQLSASLGGPGPADPADPAGDAKRRTMPSNRRRLVHTGVVAPVGSASVANVANVAATSRGTPSMAAGMTSKERGT